MISCPNKKLKAWKDLVKVVGEDKAHLLWTEYDGIIPDKYYEVRPDIEKVDKTIPQISFQEFVDDNAKELFPEDIEEPTSLNDNSDAKTLLFGSKDVSQVNADEVLNRLISSDVFEENVNEGFFLERSMNLLGKSGAKLIIATPNMHVYKDFVENENVVMVHDPMTNNIYVTEESMANFTKYDLAGTFIHEAVHSITAQAYFNPKTFEEKEFKRFIDKSYEQYKHLSTKRDSQGRPSYGFTNQAEFIAEIFSNPAFRAEIQSIEKSFLAKFIDEVRRIMYMVKNGFNNDLVKSAVLFEVVDRFSTEDKSRWKGTIVKDPRYEVFGRILPKEINEMENNSIENKISLLLNKQLDNMEQVVRKAAKQSDTTEGMIFLSGLKELEHSMVEAMDTNKLESINLYADFMIEQIKSVYTLVNKPMNQASKLVLVEKYQTFLGATDLLEMTLDTLTDEKISQLTEEQKVIAKQILKKLKSIGGRYNFIKSKFKSMLTDGLRKELKSSYFTEKVIKDFRDKIGKEYPENSNLSKEAWIDTQVKDRQEELDELIEKDIDEVLDKASKDISSFDFKAYSVLNTKSRLIQIAWKMIERMRSKFNNIVAKHDFILDKLHQDLVKEKGSYDVSNMFEIDKDGESYVKGEYSLEYKQEYKNYSKILDEVNELKIKLREQGITTEVGLAKNTEMKALYAKAEEWRKEHTISQGEMGGFFPKAKYKNDLKFSKAEQAIYEQYKKLAEKSRETFGRENSIKKTIGGATYYTIPYATKSGVERMLNKDVDIVEMTVNKFNDLRNFKMDEIENREEMYTSSGNRIHSIPVLYRNNLDKNKEPDKYKLAVKEQSRDLLTLMRLENRNQTNFLTKQEQELALNSLVEVAKNKKYLRTSTSNNIISNLFGSRAKEVYMDGVESNEFKRLRSVVDQALYNVFTEDTGKMKHGDMNKIVKTINSWTGFLGMTFNYFSAPVNVLNAEFQTFLLKIGGDMDKNAISSAHAFYFSEMPEILADTGRPVAHSLTNQMNAVFDIFGGLTSNQVEFIKNSFLKANVNMQSLQILQKGGEHMVQSVLTIAILKSIKVKNANKKYVNKEGKVVKTKEEAASVFDMISLNSTTKQLQFSGDFEYTDKSTITAWDDGGFENVKLFIKKKLEDTMGQHDKNYQSEYQKHWFGQLLSMYKKHVIPLGLARFKGLSMRTVFTDPELLGVDDRAWNEFSQKYEEGYYTTAARLMLGPFNKGIINGLVNMKWILMSSEWKKLSEEDRYNMRKMVFEMSVISLLNMVIFPLFMAMGAEGDDDDIFIPYMALTARRLEQELSFYYDITEAYKVTRNPIASLNVIEDVLSVSKFMITPSAYMSENEDGESRFLNALGKVAVPNVFREKTTIDNSLNFMNRNLIRPVEESMFYRLWKE